MTRTAHRDTGYSIAKELKTLMQEHIKRHCPARIAVDVLTCPEKPQTVNVGIHSVLLTFFVACLALDSINTFVRKNRFDGLRRINIYPAFKELKDVQNRNLISWSINGLERRRKKVHERHFWVLLNYLSKDVYQKYYLNHACRKDRRFFCRLLTDSGLHRKTILKTLQRLEANNALNGLTAREVLARIEDEWQSVWLGRRVGKIILTRWKAIQMATRAGLIADSRTVLRSVYVWRRKLGPKTFVDVFEKSEEIKSGQTVSSYRGQVISLRRQLLIYIIYHASPMTELEIARSLGGRNHSTISYSLAKVGKMVEHSSYTRLLLEYYCIFFDNIRIYMNRDYFFPEEDRKTSDQN